MLSSSSRTHVAVATQPTGIAPAQENVPPDVHSPSFHTHTKDARSLTASPTQLHRTACPALRVREDDNAVVACASGPFSKASSDAQERHAFHDAVHAPAMKHARAEVTARSEEATFAAAPPHASPAGFSLFSTRSAPSSSSQPHENGRCEPVTAAQTERATDVTCVGSAAEQREALRGKVVHEPPTSPDTPNSVLPHSPTTVLLGGGGGGNSGVAARCSEAPSSGPPSSPSLSASTAQRIHQHELQASDFQHEEVLGEGSYSLVSLATHRTSGLLFALKEIDRARLRHLQLEPQLRWEINLQRTLRHPNIVRLYSYFITPACISLVLEYCRRGTLQQRVCDAPHGRLTEPQASRYARHVAKALAHLHRLGVAHRDLKLENVLLDEDGIAKLADFGWSRPVGVMYTVAECRESSVHRRSECGREERSNTGEAAVQLCSESAGQAATHNTASTPAGETDAEAEVEGRRTICGTLDYLSPEMVSGHTHSFKTDVWSLGVMVAEMLTGSPPFYKDSTQQTLHAIRCEAPNLAGPTPVSGSAADGSGHVAGAVPREEAQRTPPVLSACAVSFIESLLQKDPEMRPTMEEVLQHPWLQKPTRPSR